MLRCASHALVRTKPCKCSRELGEGQCVALKGHATIPLWRFVLQRSIGRFLGMIHNLVLSSLGHHTPARRHLHFPAPAIASCCIATNIPWSGRGQVHPHNPHTASVGCNLPARVWPPSPRSPAQRVAGGSRAAALLGLHGGSAALPLPVARHRPGHGRYLPLVSWL